jgi:hypothetical protein
MLYIKGFTQQRMSITDLLTLQECPDLLEYGLYVGKTPGETGAK